MLGFHHYCCLQSARVVAGNTLIKLSEQDLVDCDESNNACNGGNLTLAGVYLKRSGVVTEELYPCAGVTQEVKDHAKCLSDEYGYDDPTVCKTWDSKLGNNESKMFIDATRWCLVS